MSKGFDPYPKAEYIEIVETKQETKTEMFNKDTELISLEKELLELQKQKARREIEKLKAELA